MLSQQVKRMTTGDESIWDLEEEDEQDAHEAPMDAEPASASAVAPADNAALEAGEEPSERDVLAPERRPEPGFFDEEDDEEAVGTSSAGKAASDALVSLGRAARSYLLYEPDNKAIRNFLDDMRTKFRAYLEHHGVLKLAIRPWEMVLGGEVVYLNRDRERSLSFRLFRDGVRGLAIQPDVEWDEITQLLGILSIRYVGVRQQEDDIVTLLWKAGFKNIEVDSVEGFVPEDDETEVVDEALLSELGDGGGVGLGAMSGSAPEGFDVPWPEYTKRVPLSWKPVDEDRLTEVAREDSNVALPEQCVRLLREVLEVACNPVEPLELDEATPILREIRDFLLSEGLLSSLLEVMHIINALPFREKDLERQQELLEAFTDERALSRIIRSVPAGSREVPAELQALVDSIPGNAVPLLLGILRKERTNTSRWVCRTLIAGIEGDHTENLAQAVRDEEPAVAADLLQVLAQIDPARGASAALDLVRGADIAVQLQALAIIENAPYSEEIGKRLAQLMDGSSLEVRLRALLLLEQYRERWAFHAISSRLQRNANRDMAAREVDALAKAMVHIWEERAFHVFLGWVKPRGILKRVLLGQNTLRRAAVTGLSYIPGEQSEEYIREVIKNAGEELHEHCNRCLARHRRLGVRIDHDG